MTAAVASRVSKKVSTLISALVAAGHTPFAYSGRAMYGKQCVAVSSRSLNTASLPAGAKTDSLGKDTVTYWPAFEAPEDLA